MTEFAPLLDAVQATGKSPALYLDKEAIGVCVQVSGTFLGTVQFESSIDGSNYAAVGLVPLAANTTRTTTTTAAGLFAGYLPGATTFRVNVTAYTSGSITVSAQALTMGERLPLEIVAALGNDNIADDAGIVGSKLAANARKHVSPITAVMDLSGSAVADTPWLHFSVAATLTALYAVYVEAASDDVGVEIQVGKQGAADHFATITSKPEAEANEQVAATLLQTAIAAGDTLAYNCAGGKTGAGTCFLVAEYTIDD
jgi:hypothetical protein